MNYSESVILNPASVVFAHTYNLNSVYDPNRTGAGHQPMFYDQLQNIYNRYAVIGVKYSILFTGANTPLRVGILPTNNVSPTDVQDLAETPFARTAIINTMSSGGKVGARLSGYINLSKFLGEPLDDQDGAITNASPANVLILSIRGEALDGSTAITNCNMIVRLTYYTRFHDLLPVTGS